MADETSGETVSPYSLKCAALRTTKASPSTIWICIYWENASKPLMSRRAASVQKRELVTVLSSAGCADIQKMKIIKAISSTG